MATAEAEVRSRRNGPGVVDRLMERVGDFSGLSPHDADKGMQAGQAARRYIKEVEEIYMEEERDGEWEALMEQVGQH